MKTEKLTIEQLQEFFWIWEQEICESIVDSILDVILEDIPKILDYWSGKFPDLFKYIMGKSNNSIPWTSIEGSVDSCGCLSDLVKEFYGGEYYEYEDYKKSILPWCSFIHDEEYYYDNFKIFVEEGSKEESENNWNDDYSFPYRKVERIFNEFKSKNIDIKE